MSFILNDIERKELFRDCKTILQEEIQGKYHETVTYEVTGYSGPEHNRQFIVQAKSATVCSGKDAAGLNRPRTGCGIPCADRAA